MVGEIGNAKVPVKKRDKNEIVALNRRLWDWVSMNFDRDGNPIEKQAPVDADLVSQGINSGSLRKDGNRILLTLGGIKFLKKIELHNKVLSRGIPIEKRDWISSPESIILKGGRWWRYQYNKSVDSRIPSCMGNDHIIVTGLTLLSSRFKVKDFDNIPFSKLQTAIDRIISSGIIEVVVDDEPVRPFAYQRHYDLCHKQYYGAVWFKSAEGRIVGAIEEAYYDLIYSYWPRKREVDNIYFTDIGSQRVFYYVDKWSKNVHNTFNHRIAMLCGEFYTLEENGWPKLEVD